MLKLEELLEYAEQLKDNKKAKITLYFVTRHLKSGMSKAAKVTDKYDFKVVKAPIAPDIADFFKNTLSNQIISHASKDDIEMKNYTVIDDDIDNKIYAYAMNNAISFSKIINEDIKNDKLNVLSSLAEVQEDLWAYCIKVQNGLELTYSFRKISKGKVTTNEPQNIGQRVFALFDKSDKELRAFDGSAINFDDKIDCIYIQNKFYVFHKKSFESIVGLDAEFTEAAQKTLNTIKEFDLVDGKIIIEDERQGRNFLRLLNDYYKQGMTTKKYYGTDSGNIVNPVKN